MKLRLLILAIFLMGPVLLTSPGVSGESLSNERAQQTQALEAPDRHHRPFDPFAFGRGRPLPGSDYPEKVSANSIRAQSLTASPPEGIDLDVTYINRSPMYKAYCVNYSNGIPTLCAGTEGEKRWPDPVETVTFTAHVINKGTQASPDFSYQWFIDDVEESSGVHPALDPGSETSLTYQWIWAHTMDGERVVDDHTVRFAVDPSNTIPESYESNNSLEDGTNALGFRIAITPAMVEAYNTPLNPLFSYSAEDWLQRQITAMNWSLAHSTYPTSPGGATERVRINDIVITASPPINDGSHDGGWFVNADYRFVSGGYDSTTDIDWNLVHELSHQIGIIDLYNLDIPSPSVLVLDNEGTPANFGFYWPRPGIMGGGDIAPHSNHHLYSSHSAAGLSSTGGYRRGYYGEYQFDIPEQNYLLILDNQVQPAGGVEVSLYQRTGAPDWVGDLRIDNIPEISGTTAANGRFLLTNRSVGTGVTTRTGHTLHDNPFGLIDVIGKKNRFLLKLEKGDHEEFAWLDITAFNLAYWQGDHSSHTFTIHAHLPPGEAPERPAYPSARIQGNQASLCWQASSSPGVTGYRIYRAGPPVYTYELIGDGVSGSCYVDSYSGGNRVYAITAVDSSGRESGFSDFVWAPRLINPHGIGITGDGTRVILDPQNGYALLRQRANGVFTQNFGSPHYHLEYSYFMAIDEEDHLIFSHPGDYYNSRHSVRVADRDANPILEFGERGTGPGQFETPTGVANWGDACDYEGPYPVDGHTLLLLHYDGSYTGAQGEPGNFSGTTFAAGRYDQGVEVDNGDLLTYSSAGNLNRTQGAVEFWLQPKWNGGDGESYTFFEAGTSWFNRLRVMKDGANNLRFMVWDSSQEYGVAYNVAHWESGEWHHVVATWKDNTINLIVDGLLRDSRDTANPPDLLAATIYVGSSLWHDQQAEAVIDELRISDVPRIGNSDSCSYHFIVADSGNHRIQAFNASGGFVVAYGGYGSGVGEFNNPQGVAVDSHGRVVVADSGNNRLQVLNFDGSNFSFESVITAGFNWPTGVTAERFGDSDGRIVVADTNNDRIVVLDDGGDLLGVYTGPNDGSGGSFNRPRGVAVEPPGQIVVADTGNKRIVLIRRVFPEHLFLPMVES